jgi:hypothetical protein
MAQPRNSDGTFAGKNAKLKNIFDEIQQILDGVRPYPLRFKIRNEVSVYAYEFFLSNVKKLSKLTTQKALESNMDLRVSSFELGGLYQYAYLPYEESQREMEAYDMYPLMLPIGEGTSKSGHKYIQGLNLHYINMRERFFLFAHLLEIGRVSGSDKNKKLMLTYKLLQAVSKNPMYKPCIHNYVMENVKSQIISIPIDQWKIACVMPNAKFKKMSEMAVHAASYRRAMLGWNI